MVYGLWFMVYGLWFMVYGLRSMVNGFWFMVYGLWFMIDGLVFRMWGQGFRSLAGQEIDVANPLEAIPRFIWCREFGAAGPAFGAKLTSQHRE